MVNNPHDTGPDPRPTGRRTAASTTLIAVLIAWIGNTMATDYDAPRKQEEELKEDSIEELKTRRNEQQHPNADEDDEATAADGYELPGADLSHEELSVVVLPAQEDEFTCGSCFLVRHRSQIAEEKNGVKICVECAG